MGTWYGFTKEECELIHSMRGELSFLEATKSHGTFCQHVGMGKCGTTFFHLKVWPIINPGGYFFIDAQVEHKLLKNKSIIVRRTAKPFDINAYSNSIKKQREIYQNLTVMHFDSSYQNIYSPQSISNLSVELGTQDMEQIIILLARSHKELLISKFSHQLNKGALDTHAKLRNIISCSRSACTLKEIRSLQSEFNVDSLNYPLIIDFLKKHLDCKVFFVDLDTAINSQSFWYLFLNALGYMGDGLQKYSEVIQKYVASISPIKQNSSRIKTIAPDSVLLTKRQEDLLETLWQEDCSKVAELACIF